jgi:DNA-binding SARP family transcriptional activator
MPEAPTGTATSDREVLIRVLGPIDLVRDGVVTSLGSVHIRHLLGMLVIAAGHSVSNQRLEAAMWDERVPPSADDSLHTYVSRLRHLLGHEMIELKDHGYRLAVTRDQIDALRFEDLFVIAEQRRAEPEACLALCRQALDMWRGEPFGDLTDAEPFRLEAMRLAELRSATMELALGCELALGRSASVVAELESAVQEYPYRERLWYLLIDALDRQERRVEALRAAQRLRSVLADAGLDVSDELKVLEDRILQGSGPGSAGQQLPG